MSTALRLLVRDLVDEVLTHTEINMREECVEFDMGDSERAAFELKWEEKLRAAVNDEARERILGPRGKLADGYGGPS